MPLRPRSDGGHQARGLQQADSHSGASPAGCAVRSRCAGAKTCSGQPSRGARSGNLLLRLAHGQQCPGADLPSPQGVAETGSGKTAAFLLPMLMHIMEQPELREGEGPIAIIMAPTRELAEQIHREARRFAKGYGLRVCAAFGGLEKRTQVKDLKAGSEVQKPGSIMYPDSHPTSVQHTLKHVDAHVHVLFCTRGELRLMLNVIAGGGVHTWTHDRSDQDEGLHAAADDVRGAGRG